MMQDSAGRIARIAIESKLVLEEESYVESFRPHLMDVVHAWSSVSTTSVCIVQCGLSLPRCFTFSVQFELVINLP